MADETRTVQAGGWHDAVAAGRDEGFAFFDWLSAVDRADDAAAPGVDLVCHLYDIATPGALRGLLLTTRVADGEPVASVTDVFAGAAWHERETHEMFGVEFAGFDDGTGLGVRPLLLPDGFEGTPLRKSFQLAARATKPWPGGKEPGEGHESARSPSRRRVQAAGVPPPEWGPR
ncbi:NADH-quinone oxidoreductase subunit C [uncultured Phycicoccus sp.]|uniref:NADH-quinone oxidoreductase subunit C n=1 Tax=uncultured Phycicoccus sp. TaxID=661422 RepID=UPI00260E93D2|nr:NADH-quinone oxidoreductase subunit C [uncultured Phycicoccus sp.]